MKDGVVGPTIGMRVEQPKANGVRVPDVDPLALTLEAPSLNGNGHVVGNGKCWLKNAQESEKVKPSISSSKSNGNSNGFEEWVSQS